MNRWQRWMAWMKERWVDRPLPPGTIRGRYRIIRTLGLGSYGIAYLAIQLETGQEYVMKQVKPSLRQHPKGPAMQAYEWRVLNELAHPQIPRAIERFREKGDWFLVMSKVPGITLEELLFDRQSTFTAFDALLLVRRIAEIVRHLHTHGLIHRDVRIPNLLVDDGVPYLIDFGLARYLGDAPTYESADLLFYPSEKQIRRKVEPQSDLYSLGHLLLFLLYSAYEEEDTLPNRSWEEELNLSPELRRILRKLLLIDPPYPDVDAFLAEITHVQRTT